MSTQSIIGPYDWPQDIGMASSFKRGSAKVMKSRSISALPPCSAAMWLCIPILGQLMGHYRKQSEEVDMGLWPDFAGFLLIVSHQLVCSLFLSTNLQITSCFVSKSKCYQQCIYCFILLLEKENMLIKLYDKTKIKLISQVLGVGNNIFF